jgi:putative NIF3 family GTP cyclohydrolase 1 type 2
MIQINRIAGFLEEYFHSRQFTDESPLIRDTSQPVRRLGLALEPWPDMATWAVENDLEALFLHRPWALALESLPEKIGIVSSHRGFDHQLTLGFNPRLADALGMSAISVLGRKEGRPCGMMGTVPTQQVAQYFRSVREVFGGYEEAHTCEQDSITKVAVVGAMNKTLVHQASDRGASVYITGEYRQPGRIGVLETGIGVVIVGHQRSEEWGLRALAGVLQERWAGLEIVLAPAHQTK